MGNDDGSVLSDILTVEGEINAENGLAVNHIRALDAVVDIGSDLNMLGTRSIVNFRAKTSFRIPSNVTCDIYSDVDFHNYTIKNFKLSNLAANIDFRNYTASNIKISNLVSINGYTPYSGNFPVVTKIENVGDGTIRWYNSSVTVKNGIITAAPASI